MSNGGLLTIVSLIGSNVINSLRLGVIEDVDGGVNSFPPIGFGEILPSEHSKSHLDCGFVLVFCHPILL